MKSQLVFIFIAILAGALLPIQAGLNIQLGKAVHHPIFAAFVSFVVGSIALLAYLFIVKYDFETMKLAANASPWVWLSGFLGAFYVSTVIILSPKLGVALTFSLVVAGQMTLSLILDHFGLLGMPVKHINWPKVLGVMLLISGVIIIRKF